MGRAIGRNGGGARRRAARGAVAALAVALLSFAVLAPARAEVSLTKGSGSATATVAGVNIPYGGANIGLEVGHSDASFFEDTAKAGALTFDPAFLRLATILQVCGGAFPLDLPDPTVADTNTAGQKAVTHTTSVAPGVGVEEATAEPGSHSRGRATGGAVGIPGVVELHGGVATSETRLDPGKQARTMVATVDSGTIDLVAGLVRLEGLQWRLEQVAVGPDSRTTKVTTSSTFTFGSISLAGVPLPAATADQAASSIATVNAALQPLGIEIRLPELRKYGATGQQLTPLTVAVGGGGTAWGPVLYPLIAGSDATSVVNLFNSLTEPTIFEPVKCESLFGLLKANPEANRIVNTLGLLTPVVLSAVGAALNGGAEVDVEIGGARTSYDDTYYPPRTVTAPTRPAPVGAAPAGRQPARLPALPPEVAVGTAVRTSVSCATSSPVGSPGCSKGAAALAAGLAGALTVGLLATDELWRRRRLRSAPPTTQEVVS